MNPYPSTYGLNSTTNVLLEVRIWYLITYKGWYAIKQKKPNQTLLLCSDTVGIFLFYTPVIFVVIGKDKPRVVI